METKPTGALRRGVVVFAGLAVLTLLEYFLSIQQAPMIFLWVVALFKAGIVIWFFMHIFRLWTRDEGEH